MNSPHQPLEIVVEEKLPVDAALTTKNGVRTLHLRPQTVDSAVRNIRNAVPEITLEDAERLVQQHCPEFPGFDDLLGLTDPRPPSIEGPAASPPSEPTARRRSKAVLVAALIPALAASWALGRYTTVAEVPPKDAAASTPDAEPDAGAAAAPFTDPEFEFFSGASTIVCDPISTLEAECTDSDGVVMLTKAATGPDSTIFTFSYGSERIGLRIFYDAAYASTWSRQDGSRELYPHMRVHDRYVLWGTDPDRIEEYADLLEAPQPQEFNVAERRGSAPLPPRLAALTLGTLGLDGAEVRQIIAKPAGATVDAPTMLAARLVLGLEPAPGQPPHANEEDIVALAAGIEPPTRAEERGGNTQAPSTGTPSTTPKNPTGPRPPATSPGPTPPPTAPPPATTPPPQVPPPPTSPAPEPTPTPPPPSETPAPPVEQPSPPVVPPPTEEVPAEGDPSLPATEDPGHEEDDLLILPSAWTLAVV
ncbi:hypothetical protein ACWGMW_07915 [Streptomyces albidoflavus]